MQINEILKSQRNSYPYLFVDRVLEIEPGKSAVCLKLFSYNELFFPGHFADEPNVPGFIQLETLVQSFLLTFQCKPEFSGLRVSDARFSNVRFQRKIVPGDALRIEAHLEYISRGIAQGFAKSYVGSEPACSGEFVVVIPDILTKFKPRTT